MKTRHARPDTQAERLFRAAVAKHRGGDLAGAMAGYREVLARDPDAVQALYLLGSLCRQTGDPDSAVALLGKACRLKPELAEAQFNLGNALRDLGRMVEAAACYRQAIAHRPDFADAHVNHANALKALDRLTEADEAYRAALAIRPDFAEAHYNRGQLLQALERPEAAIEAYRAAFSRGRDSAEARLFVGTILEDQERFEEAGAEYRIALAREPDHALARNNLGNILLEQGQPHRAERLYRQALALDPSLPQAWNNLAQVRRRRQYLAGARRAFERAVQLQPDFHSAGLAGAMTALANGALAGGWERYEHRFPSGDALPDRRFSVPHWCERGLSLRSLVVWREQGIGDELLFATCYPDLLGLPIHVRIECTPRFVSLFTRSFPLAHVRAVDVDEHAPPTLEHPGTEAHCPAGSLPRRFRTRLSAFPLRTRFLAVERGQFSDWILRLARLGPGLKVGICWRSSVMTKDRASAYTGLADWAPILALAGIHFVMLQYDGSEVEIAPVEEALGVRVLRWPDLDLRDDLEGVAALTAALDLVITAPTSVGELAGAVGTPVWRFNLPGDWTTLGTRVRPWYPSMRLFSAAPGEPLAAVLSRIAVALKRMSRPAPGRA